MAKGTGDNEFQGLEWTIENFSSWNGEGHHGKVLPSHLFAYGSCTSLKLYFAADKYQVPSLKRECVNFLCGHITLSNVCKILSLAEKHQVPNLISAAHNFILENFSEVLASEKWKSFMRSEPLLVAETVTYLAQKKCAGK